MELSKVSYPHCPHAEPKSREPFFEKLTARLMLFDLFLSPD
jgi:hypothetical protein